MIKRTLTTAVFIVSISVLPFFACKKPETPNATTPPSTQEQAHEKDMLKKSFEESKKAAAAKVNGEVITMFSLLREMNAIAPGYLPAGQAATPELNAKIRKDALNTLITVTLAVQDAKKRGMTVKPEVIDNAIKAVKESKGSPEAFQAYLADGGLTEEELRKNIEQEALFEVIAMQEIDGKIKITEAALRERFKRDKDGLAAKDASHGKMTFEEARGLLEDKMKAEAGEKRMKAWEKELRKKASIEITEQKEKQG